MKFGNSTGGLLSFSGCVAVLVGLEPARTEGLATSVRQASVVGVVGRLADQVVLCSLSPESSIFILTIIIIMAGGRGRGRGGGGIRAGNVKRRFGGREPQHHQHRHLQHATSSQTPAATTTTTTSHHRPRRGPPAIFVTCEAGREHKCKRETFELLHHYYYASRGANNDDEKGTVSSTSFSATTTAPPSTTPFLSSSLTLEEELSMLRKGAVADEVLSHQPNSKRPRFEGDDYGGDCGASMKSPFAIYDTGMRGMICILCTLPQCEYIPYDEILMQLRIAKENKKKEDNHCSSGNDGDMQRAAVTTTTTTTTTLAAIAAVEDDEEGPSSSLPRGDQEEARGDQKTNNPSPILWDPVQTVKCILGDAKRKRKSDDDEEGQKSNYDSPPNSNIECAMTSDDQTISSPPGSRFISRILPMQATVSVDLMCSSLFCASLSSLSQVYPRSHVNLLFNSLTYYSPCIQKVLCIRRRNQGR